MMFNSIPFIILFPAVVIAYRLIPEKVRYVWLLVISLVFYSSAGMGCMLLLTAVTVFIYLTGLALSGAKHPVIRRIILACAAAALILVLFIFKYLNLALSLSGSMLRFDIILPLGLSFYTFQALSYIADVYKQKTGAEKNILKLALYLCFFLSVVSGPINRAGDILPEFSGKPASYDDIREGMQKMLWGYFLKLAVAGRLNIVITNVYGDIGGYSGFAVAVTALLYIFMLYCDFEGYSQIAIGGGYILGIRMKENFRQPFYAESLSEIWRRWHISLSTWFRDYVYIPLGGSRCSVSRKYLNLFIVMFLSGIWHGADLSFFLWGALFGVLMIAGQIFLPARDAAAAAVKRRLFSGEGAGRTFDSIRSVFKRAGVYVLFAFVFIFFANDGIASSLLAVRTIFTRFMPAHILQELFGLGLGRFNLAITLVMMAFVLAADGAANKRQQTTPSLIKNIPAVFRWVIYWGLVFAIMFSANLSGKEFIYSAM